MSPQPAQNTETLPDSCFGERSDGAAAVIGMFDHIGHRSNHSRRDTS